MQKLLYVAHGWHLALYDAPLIADEYLEAWQYGPAYASVYYEFRDFGRLPITRLATELHGTGEVFTPAIRLHFLARMDRNAAPREEETAPAEPDL